MADFILDQSLYVIKSHRLDVHNAWLARHVSHSDIVHECLSFTRYQVSSDSNGVARIFPGGREGWLLNVSRSSKHRQFLQPILLKDEKKTAVKMYKNNNMWTPSNDTLRPVQTVLT